MRTRIGVYGAPYPLINGLNLILVVTGFLMHGWIDGVIDEWNRLKGVQFVCENPIISKEIHFSLTINPQNRDIGIKNYHVFQRFPVSPLWGG